MSERASIPPSSKRVSVKASISVIISKWKYLFLTFPEENNNFILRLDLLFDTYDFSIWPVECCKEANQEQQGHGELQKLIHDQTLKGFSTFRKLFLSEKPKDFSCKVHIDGEVNSQQQIGGELCSSGTNTLSHKKCMEKGDDIFGD